MRTDCNRDLEQENFFEWMLDRVLIFLPIHGKRQLEDYSFQCVTEGLARSKMESRTCLGKKQLPLDHKLSKFQA